MATLAEKVSLNATGRYYVDSTCIDCDQCRALAPEIFGRTEDGLSYVIRQPVTQEEIDATNEALDACATQSIGNDGE